MTVTLEIEGTIKVVDTAGIGALLGPSLVKSLAVVEHAVGKSTLASAGTLTVNFGAVAAGKALIIKISAGPATVTFTNNGVSSGAQQFDDLFVLVNGQGGITAASVTQSTGSSVLVDTLVVGST